MPTESQHAVQYFLRAEAALAVLEAMRGLQLHGPHHSYHEAYAVALEEVDEVWSEIKMKEQDHERIEKEAIQVAAMFLRLAAMAKRQRGVPA